MGALAWGPLGEGDLHGLRRLARACLRADGGLPLLEREDLLRARFLTPRTTGARDELGELVAAGAVSEPAEDGSVTAMGLVHPSFRGAGIGSELMAWAAEQAGGAALRVATETLTPGAERLYAAHGLVQTFAETVMRHDLTHIPRCPPPRGVRTVAFGEESAPAFHAAYSASFSDRPGFPAPSAQEWLGFLAEDDDFRPDLSRVALDVEGRPVGFVTVSGAWIDQVGVVPDWRGTGLGAHLTARSLTAIHRTGAEQAWLAVNTDNSRARRLYERLGFEVHGTRARYAAPATPR
jgi:mycothiol synthase